MDPERRRRYGVYATPPALVGYMVRSAHKLAQQKLGLPSGLADPEAFLLDPAAGEMEFLLAAWELALAGRGPQEGAALLRDHLLPHSRGIEIRPRVVDAAGMGLVAFVLPSSLLDAPTFRGLRHSLKQAFEEIRILDLHGGRGERLPEGVPVDENVFPGIRQGVAVLFLVKSHPVRLLPRDLAFYHRLAEELGLTLGRATELAPIEEGDPT